MNVFLEILFWVSVFLIIYTYLLYPLILVMIRTLRRRYRHTGISSRELPTVTMVVAAYNEEDIIAERLRNLEILTYPKDTIEFVFGSDGSTDKTNSILRSFKLQNFHFEVFENRRGKASVLNDLLERAKGEIIVFSDSNTFYAPDTIIELVQPFSDPLVGGVCGELILKSKNLFSGGLGEKSYWSYENLVKRLESEIRTTVGATGAVYAIRKNLFAPLPTDRTIMDDFLIPMNILRRGYTMKYSRRAVAYEAVTSSVSGEFQRKVRIGAANLNGFSEFADLLHPRFGFLAFALWSHKVIRWCVPLLLLIVLGSSTFLAGGDGLYRLILIMVLAFLVFGLAGYACEKFKVRIGILGLPYYFIAVNAALFVGFIKFLFRRQKPTWEIVR